MDERNEAVVRAEGGRILIIEDELSQRQLLASYFKKAGYQVVEAWSAKIGEALLELLNPDILILDLQLDDGDGRPLLKLANKIGSKTIITSASRALDDKITCFQMGADDYVQKPFDVRELAARISNLQKKSRGAIGAPNVVDLGRCRVDLIARKVLNAEGRAEDLSPSEFELLRMFLSARGFVVTRDEIARVAISKKIDGQSRAVDVLVSKLRRKLDQGKHPTFIHNIRGKGYLFTPDQPAQTSEKL